MDIKLWTLPSGSVLIDVVGLTNSVGFAVKNFGFVFSLSCEAVFDANVEIRFVIGLIEAALSVPGAIEVVVLMYVVSSGVCVCGVKVAEQKILQHFNGLSIDNTQKFN